MGPLSAKSRHPSAVDRFAKSPPLASPHPFQSLFPPRFPLLAPRTKSQVIKYFLGDGVARSAPPPYCITWSVPMCTPCVHLMSLTPVLSVVYPNFPARFAPPPLACFAPIQDTFCNFLAFFDEMRPSVRMHFLGNPIAFLKRNKILTEGAGFVTESLITLGDWQLSLNAGSL